MESVLIYVLVFLSVFLINTIAGKIYPTKRKLSNFLIFVGFSILLIFVGCRYYVGTDYESYMNMYNTVSTLDFSELYLIDVELGAKVLFKLIQLIFDNQYVIFIGLALLTLYPLYKANKLFDYKYLAFSILTYCFMFLPFSMNGMRQGVAMSFIFLSFTYLFKDKKISMLISFIIAFLFHKSSILLLPYLVLFMIRKNRLVEFDSVIITLILSVGLFFFNNLLMKVGIISDYEYLLSELSINNIAFKSVLLFIPFVLILIGYNNKKEQTYEMRGMVISGIILTLVGTTKQFLSRISLYHNMFLIFLMPMLFQNSKNKTNKIIIELLYILYLIVYFIYECYMLGKHEIFPYQNWLIMGLI